MDFIDELMKIFLEEYKFSRGDEYLITNNEKQRSAIGKLLKIIKQKNKDANSEKVKSIFRDLFKKCLLLKEDFFYDSMCPSFILNQLNTIREKLKKKIEILTYEQVEFKVKTEGVTVRSKYQMIDINGKMRYVAKENFDPKKYKKWEPTQPKTEIKITGQYEDGKKVQRQMPNLIDIYNEAAKTSGGNLIVPGEQTKQEKFRERFRR